MNVKREKQQPPVQTVSSKVAVQPADVQTVIDFLETDVFRAVFTERGLAALSFHDIGLEEDNSDSVPGTKSELSRTGSEQVRMGALHRVDLRKLLAEGKAFPQERQLIRETVRFLKTGRHGMPLDFSGCTPFQQRVYEAVASIQPGKLCTYKHVAMMIGQPTAARAVGNAMAQEPVAYFLPAHRVVPQNGLGFCRSGSARSRLKLLEREGHDVMQLAGGKVCSRQPCCLE